MDRLGTQGKGVARMSKRLPTRVTAQGVGGGKGPPGGRASGAGRLTNERAAPSGSTRSTSEMMSSGAPSSGGVNNHLMARPAESVASVLTFMPVADSSTHRPLHDAPRYSRSVTGTSMRVRGDRSEEHTSELQSPDHL